ncbi:MAG: GGDEF domain-containing protein [Candidatus Izemoplasmataceae bacterium]|jgi:diguanylate cyclase (GGDEF)-like protein
MESSYDIIKKTYGLDVIDDILLKKDKHVEFVFNLQKKPMTVHIIKGDTTAIGLPNKIEMPFKELLTYVVDDNALAEIEGKKTFAIDLITKINSIKEDLYVFIPVGKDGNILWLTVGFYVLSTNKDKPELIHGRVHRVSNKTPLEITYYKKAYQDELTGLFTRETLKMHFEKLKNIQGGYGLFIDIDGFKSVNDQFGHKAGNSVLKCIADAFINNWEKNVIYYRLGGDEFFVYVWDHDEEKVINRAKRIISTIENLECEDIKLDISAAVGIVPISSTCVDYAHILDMSDSAMYKAKSQGRGQIYLVNDIT